MARRHWLTEAYLALSDLGTMSEPEGRALLKKTFPTMAHLVDSHVDGWIAEATGKAPRQADDADVAARPARPAKAGDFNDTLRDQFNALRNGARLPDTGDMSENIRQKLSEKRLTINRDGE
jgi:hypothetical protein